MEKQITALEEKPFLRHTGAEIVARRKAQLGLRLRGKPRAEIIRELEPQYGAESLDFDWKRRKTWLFEIMELDDAESMIAEVMGNYTVTKEVRHNILETVLDIIEKYKAKQGGELNIDSSEPLQNLWGAAMRCVESLDKNAKERSDILMRLGILREAPKKLEIDKREASVHVDITEAVKKAAEEMDEEAKMKFFAAIAAQLQANRE